MTERERERERNERVCVFVCERGSERMQGWVKEREIKVTIIGRNNIFNYCLIYNRVPEYGCFYSTTTRTATTRVRRQVVNSNKFLWLFTICCDVGVNEEDISPRGRTPFHFQKVKCKQMLKQTLKQTLWKVFVSVCWGRVPTVAFKSFELNPPSIPKYKTLLNFITIK